MLHHIAVAADGSEHSLRALDRAIDLAKRYENAKLELLYVVDGATSKSDALSSSGVEEMAERRRMRLSSAEEKAKKEGVSYEIKILHGEPGPAIVNYANEHHIDMIVIGSRGLNAFQEFVLGSVSHKVAKRALCPVLIVK